MFGTTGFTLLHVLISLVGIVTGLIVLYGMLQSRRPGTMTDVFLVTTLATSLTGFAFPFNGFTPAIGFGILSTILLALSFAGLYVFRLAGGWRKTYVITAVISLYLNVFVLVVQLFQKVPALNAFAPTGSEPPFAVVQGIVLVLFIVAGFKAVKRF